MARIYSNENFPLPVVERLRELGHDVLTTFDAGQNNQALPDEDVLAFASDEPCSLSTDVTLCGSIRFSQTVRASSSAHLTPIS